jgi:predicted MFS family arabinose efflux permease
MACLSGILYTKWPAKAAVARNRHADAVAACPFLRAKPTRQSGSMIYVTRSLVLAWYFMLSATPTTTLMFGAMAGFLWLGVGPLVAGAVAEMFGLKWQAMIQGIAFVSHQLGSFIGAYGGGLIYDALGSYDMAWRTAVALGLTAGVIQIAFALLRPTEPPLVAARGAA